MGIRDQQQDKGGTCSSLSSNFQYIPISNCVGESKSTSVDRYNSGFSHGDQQTTLDFQNNSPFNPVCAKHTGYYYAGHFKAYNVTWNNLAKQQTSNPNPLASNTTNPQPTTNTTATNPYAFVSPSIDDWVGPFVICVSVVIIIAAIAWKITHRKAKYKVRQAFPDSLRKKF